MWEKLNRFIIQIAFEKPKYPLRFRELMEANKIFTDHLDIKMIPGIRFSRLKLYIIYFILWNIVVIPLALVFHGFLKSLDCHISILLAIFFTLLFFGTYKIFEEHIKREAVKYLIKEAWQNYLPHFPYEKYAEEVAQVYKEAIDKDVPKYKIEQYIIDHLIKEE